MCKLRASIWVLCLCVSACGASMTPPTVSSREMMRINGTSVVQVFQETVIPNAYRLGTGAVVDDRGYVLTNYHVVDRNPRVETASGTGLYHVCRMPADLWDCRPAALVAVAPEYDLALLHVDDLTSGPAITFADDLEMILGDELYLWGNVSNLAPPSPMFGRLVNWITSKYLRLKYLPTGQGVSDSIALPVMLVDMSAQVGASGGPVFQEDGRCIGILFASVQIRQGNNALNLVMPSRRIIAFLGRTLPPR